MRRLVYSLGILLGMLSLVSPGAAQTGNVINYKLTDMSSFNTGCFGPCLCPILTQPLQGTFQLRHTGTDPLFEYYDVVNVLWKTRDPNSASAQDVNITGSGTYKFGGEFAVQQQMTLDLTVGQGLPQHFDSGLVTGTNDFPEKVHINISLHQNQACRDTMMHIDAMDPIVTAAEGGAPASFRADVRPNPFHESAQLRVYLDRSGPLRVNLYDVRGRVIRHLSAEPWVGAGVRVLAWDGRSDRGSSCATGVYFMGVQSGTHQLLMRIVKLN